MGENGEMKRTILWLALPMLLASASAACADQEPATTVPSIEVGPVEARSTIGGQGETRELTVTVGTGDESRQFVVQAPGSLLDRGEKAEARVVGEHLLVYTGAVIAIFDLESGEQVLDQVAAPRVVASSDGELVAFEALRRRFTPPEASSSVIEAVDVKNVAMEPVFPDRSVIRPAQFGGVLAWIEDPLDRHSAGELVFSPDGEQVAFFCTHIPATPDGLQRVFLVVIDLSGLPESRFVHVPFDWTASLQPDVDMGDRKPYFAVGSMAWSDRGEIVVHPPRYARWLKDEIDVELPGAEIWATEAHHSGEETPPAVPGDTSPPNEEQP